MTSAPFSPARRRMSSRPAHSIGRRKVPDGQHDSQGGLLLHRGARQARRSFANPLGAQRGSGEPSGLLWLPHRRGYGSDRPCPRKRRSVPKGCSQPRPSAKQTQTGILDPGRQSGGGRSRYLRQPREERDQHRRVPSLVRRSGALGDDPLGQASRLPARERGSWILSSLSPSAGLKPETAAQARSESEGATLPGRSPLVIESKERQKALDLAISQIER